MVDEGGKVVRGAVDVGAKCEEETGEEEEGEEVGEEYRGALFENLGGGGVANNGRSRRRRWFGGLIVVVHGSGKFSATNWGLGDDLTNIC